MSVDPLQLLYAHANARFGFGGRPDQPAPGDIAAWIDNQLTSPDPTPVSGMLTVDKYFGLAAAMNKAGPGSALYSSTYASFQSNGLFEIEQLCRNAVTTSAPVRERLVWFWNNHFALLTSTNESIFLAGAFVRDVIRPFVTGNFVDMLQAVIRHPAMLYSLNNDVSIGPDSAWSKTYTPFGTVININENLARETLELYTVGAGSGYTQADVDALAYLLTGFKVATATPPLGFHYNTTMAEPGSFMLLGRSFPGTNAGATAALAYLGTHPATYRNIATKLVAHYTSDTPAAADIAAVVASLSATGGNLLQAYRVIATLSNAWVPLTKLRKPADFVIAMLRATGMTHDTLSPVTENQVTQPQVTGLIAAMGGIPFHSPLPDGWSDLAADWLAPSAWIRRVALTLNYVETTVLRAQPPLTVAATTACSVQPLLSASTIAAIASVPDAHRKFTVLFTSPEFQRR